MITFNKDPANAETYLVLSVYDPDKVQFQLPSLYLYKV